MAQAQSSDPNFPETDFNLLEDSEDADNHTSSSTATRLSLQFQLDETYLGQRIDQVAATIWSDLVYTLSEISFIQLKLQR